MELEPNRTTQYFENNYAIPKQQLIKYELLHRGFPYHKKPYEKIVWEAFNSGKEAKEANELQHSFENKYVNQTFCIAHAGYQGNHFLKCTIQRAHSSNIVIRFPIYVDDKSDPNYNMNKVLN